VKKRVRGPEVPRARPAVRAEVAVTGRFAGSAPAAEASPGCLRAVFTKLYAADKSAKFAADTFPAWRDHEECQMNDHDSTTERAAIAPGGRLRRRLVVAGLAAVAVFAGFAGLPAGHRILAQVPVFGADLAAAAAPFEDGFGPGPAADWRSGLYDGMIGAVVEARADRAVRHLAIEIDATPEQQDKLRAIVRDAVKDLLPVREKLMAARATARDLLTGETVDRAAIEKFRADMLATHDAVSRRLLQAVADAAEVLKPEQRRRIADMMARHGPSGTGWGPWGHWKGWRN
jgi:periplasmic protein CpxP/Spy